MGKKAKAHRAKVAKRNKRIEQKKYSAQNALNKLMEEMALKKEEENMKVEASGKEVPFEVITEPMTSGIKGFELSDKPVNPVKAEENNNEDE